MSRLFIIVLIGVTGFFMSCRKTDSSELERLLETKEDLSVEEAKDVAINYTDSARLKATIKAPVMIRYPNIEEAYTEMPKGVYAEFYDPYGNIDSRLSAAYGVNYEHKKLIKLTDSVRVYNRKGEELRSEELFWDQEAKKIYTNTFVRIIRDGETLRGDGFESNETFTRYKILRPAGPVAVKENVEEYEEAK